jgi:hypothetical protein
MTVKIYFEARYYSTGWAFRLGIFQIRWNRQENYVGLTFEKVGIAYFSAGGLSWREFQAQKRQIHQAALAARQAAETKTG